MRELREYDALEHEIPGYTKVLKCESATPGRAAFGSQRRYPTTEDVGDCWNSRHIEGSGKPVMHLLCTLYAHPIASLPVVSITDVERRHKTSTTHSPTVSILR